MEVSCGWYVVLGFAVGEGELRNGEVKLELLRSALKTSNKTKLVAKISLERTLSINRQKIVPELEEETKYLFKSSQDLVEYVRRMSPFY